MEQFAGLESVPAHRWDMWGECTSCGARVDCPRVLPVAHVDDAWAAFLALERPLEDLLGALGDAADYAPETGAVSRCLAHLRACLMAAASK